MKFSTKRHFFVASLALLLLTALGSCGPRRSAPPLAANGSDAPLENPAPWDLVEEGQNPPPTRHSYDLSEPSADSTASATADSAAREPSQDEDTDEGTSQQQDIADDVDDVLPADLSRYNRLGRLHDLFNDSNKYQYAAGERIGIHPISSLGEAYFTRRPLVKIKSCRWYTVEDLTHSMPYLVPEAAQLLETIGRNFQDSLSRRNISGHKFRVTSVLRSKHSVKKLRRVNRNATDSSTHQLGTTFDISWSRFDHDGKSPRVSDVELKHILAEVLRDLRANRRCLVKYEVKSPCFHITATGL